MEKTNKFVPMFDLDRLNDEQLRQYYYDACAFHGVPPELNVLAFTYMDSGDGARRRVLYAKKGATDIIRDRLGISVVDLRKEIFNGTLTYTCFGKNIDGRLEIAVGASYIEGVTGRALEIAIMVAQTRAVRRMTLQFAGAGLLDETELQADSKTTDIKDALPVLSNLQPTVKPNAAPGKDITPVLALDLQGSAELLHTADRKKGFGPVSDPTPAQLEAQEALSKVKPEILAKEAGETLPEAPKRRSRQKPVELDTPFSFDNPVPAPKPTDSGREFSPMDGINRLGEAVPMSPNADIPESKRTPTPILGIRCGGIDVEKLLHPESSPVFERLDVMPVLPKAEDIIPELKAPNPPIPVLPCDTAIKTLRDKLFKYTSEILPKAGMVPTENVGGIGMKVRLYVQAKYSQVLNQLSVDQWEDMFKLFDSLTPAELVQLIDETAIKAKK